MNLSPENANYLIALLLSIIAYFLKDVHHSIKSVSEKMQLFSDRLVRVEASLGSSDLKNMDIELQAIKLRLENLEDKINAMQSS
jgi:uncharacterized protein (DUF1499 family)